MALIRGNCLAKSVDPQISEDLCADLLELAQKAGLSGAALARMLGLPANTVCVWRAQKRIPLIRIIQLAKILGLDVIHIRNRALKEYAPDLFQEDERLRKFADLTSNEADFLEIIRAAGTNPRMNDEQKAKFAEFLATLEPDSPRHEYDASIKGQKPRMIK